MNAFLSTTFAPVGTAVTTLLPRLAELGIRGVELGSIHCPEPGLMDALNRFRFRYLVHNFFPPTHDRFVVNIASGSNEIRARSLDHAKACIRFSRGISAELYTFHPGFVVDPDSESRSPGSFDFEFGPSRGKLPTSVYEEAFDRFLEGCRTLARYAAEHNVALAVESQGSRSEPDRLLLQRPEEFMVVMQEFAPGEIDFNLNLGHLPLASITFGFDRERLARAVASRTVALEVSHNEGLADDHAALTSSAWYWRLIDDPDFSHALKIFEGRDLAIEEACTMVEWLERGAKGGERTVMT